VPPTVTNTCTSFTFERGLIVQGHVQGVVIGDYELCLRSNAQMTLYNKLVKYDCPGECSLEKGCLW